MTTTTIRTTYFGGINSDVTPDDSDEVVGVVRRPREFVDRVCDRNVPALAPPEDLLDSYQGVAGAYESDGHPRPRRAAWRQLRLTDKYLAYLNRRGPDHCLDALRDHARDLDGFDTDPASGAESTPIASTRYTKEDDGLSKAWDGWVFLNPPWSSTDGSAKERWLKKARSQAGRDAVDGVVVLLPVDTSAHWFHDHILAAPAVCFVGPGRIPFEGENRNPSFELLIAVYGEVPDPLADALHSLGAVISGREVYEPTKQAVLPGGGNER